MRADELDELSRKLFGAARDERATKDARDRALRASLLAARAENRFRTPAIVAVAALAAGVAGFLWVEEQGSPSASIHSESVPREPAAAKRAEQREALRHESETPGVAEPTKPVAPPRASSAERAPATLAEELALLENARSALAAGSSGRALELLDRYERTLRGTRLRAEASILRVEALAASGRAAEAKRLARDFVKENPGSPLVDRARVFAGDAEEAPEQREPGRAP